MSASVHGEGGRPGLRLVLSAALLLDIYGVIENFFLLPAPDYQLPWSPTWLLTINDMVWPIVALLVLAVIGVLGFARGKRAQIVFGLLVLVCMAVLVEALGAHVNQHRRRFYSTGTALLGWLLGQLLGRLRGADEARSDRLAEAGAAAGLAATYSNAGIQKFTSGGLFEAHALQAHVFTHHHVDDSSPVGMLARYVATHPQLAVAIALSVIVVQLGAWTILLSPRMRMIWGTLLVGFHFGTLVFLHIIYVQATILLSAWCFPWARWLARLRGRPHEAQQPEDPPLDRRTLAAMLVVGGLGVGVAWLVPTPHPRPVFDEPPEFPPKIHLPPAPEPDPPQLEAVGPLALGDDLGGWHVTDLELREGVLRVQLRRAAHQIYFGVSGPAGDAPAGPHSEGTLHIFYDAPDELEPSEFDAAGEALRERLAADGADSGARVDAWIAAASEP